MRAAFVSTATLALLLSAPATPHADPACELVVALAPPTAADRARNAESRLEARFDALGLRHIGTLADDLPPPRVTAEMPRPVAARAGATRNPFTLDPARVILLSAPDSASAASTLEALAGDPAVAWVERNRTREVCGEIAPFPNDPLFQDGRQWALLNLGPAGPMGGLAGADIRALEAWRSSVGSGDVLLAVADTGIDPAHPDLAGMLPDGRPRMLSGVNVTSDPSGSVADSFGHGTPVTGVMCARTHDGVHFDSLGIAGVCGGDGVGNPGCRILPIKIAPGHTGTATSWNTARAMLYATALGARAMNLSFAGGGSSRLEREALYEAITHGCVVVAAAGNRGASAGTAPQYPAAYAADGLCIAVGATDPSDRRAAFSSYGPGLDLVAPGVNIWTTFMTYPSWAGASYPGYVSGSGTSFAAPHVTGVVGLMAAARPELLADDFQRLIRESAHDVGAPGVDAETGHGRLDAAAALEAVRPALGIWHDEVAADRFRVVATDTLHVGEAGPGTMDQVRLWPRAELIEAEASVALPDSFIDSVRVWPRVGGTFTVRPGFSVPYFAPWAEVAELGARSFTLRGYLYRSLDSSGGDDHLPLPPDQTRFGFTVIGRVARPPALAVAPPPPGSRVTVTPHPVRGAARITGPAGARASILDLAGRVVRRERLDPAGGAWSWDGRDARGRRVPSGVYRLRIEVGTGMLERMMVCIQ